MYARVARFEGGDAEAVRRNAQGVSERAESGPPEGLPAKGILVLIDPDNGRTLSVTLFETEDDLRQGDETLRSMNPPDTDMGSRATVETYEVGVDLRV